MNGCGGQQVQTRRRRAGPKFGYMGNPDAKIALYEHNAVGAPRTEQLRSTEMIISVFHACIACRRRNCYKLPIQTGRSYILDVEDP